MNPLQHRNRKSRGKDLSPREAQVLDLYLDGQGVSDIARLMDLSMKTISTYLVRCQEKRGVWSNAELRQQHQSAKEVCP